jgi:hypothetical protein
VHLGKRKQAKGMLQEGKRNTNDERKNDADKK